MNSKKIASLILLAIASVGQTIGQNVLDGVYVREHNPSREVVPLTHLREADVMWSKRVWRIIDVKEKMNLAFAQPEERINDRRSLNHIIYDAVKEGSMTGYKDEEFMSPMTPEEFSSFGVRVDTIWVPNPDNTDELIPTVVKNEFNPNEIIQYRVKEEWFFDKQRSVMDVRIIGIAPLYFMKDETGTIREGVPPQPVFWVYYPEARKVFANQEVFIRGNDSDRRTWDDIFLKRMFASYIYKENNVFDRRVQDYLQGMDALLEAERIKMDITNLEHDLWEF